MVHNSRRRHTLYGAGMFVLLTLTACGGTRNNPGTTPLAIEPKVLSGTVENWIGEEASLRAESYTPGITVAEAPLNADGSFRLVLPAGDEMAGFLHPFPSDGYSCEGRGATGTVEITPAPLKLAEIYRLIVSASPDDAAPELGSLYYQGAMADADISVSQMYTATAGSIRGRCTETFETDEGKVLTRTDTYEIELVAGWNEVVYVDRYSEDGRYRVSTVASTREVPTTTSWEYTESSVSTELGRGDEPLPSPNERDEPR